MSETIDITDPSDPVNVTPFSEREARQITEEIKDGLDNLGEKLLEAYRRRAWEPLGYSNFLEYGQNEFGKSRYEAYRILVDARVTSSLCTKFRTEEIKGLPVSQKELLLKLPSEQRSEALKEAQELAKSEGRKRTTAQHMRHVVQQKMAIPEKRNSSKKKKSNDAPLLAWHRPEWKNSQKFQLKEPSCWVEYSEVDGGCQFDFYLRQELGSIQIDHAEAQGWATPEVAAGYLARDLSEISPESQEIDELRNQLEQALEEKKDLKSQNAGMKLQISATELELSQLRALLADQQYIYCGENPAHGLVARESNGKAQKPTLLEIVPASEVVVMSQAHSQPELCYVRPVDANGWLEGIAVKRSDLKLRQELESPPQLGLLDEALQAAEQLRFVVEEYKAENKALAERVSCLLDESQELKKIRVENERLKRDLELSDGVAKEYFRERNEMWDKFQEVRLKNQQIQAELDARCQQPALESPESSELKDEAPPETTSRFSVGDIKSRSQLEQITSRRQMDKAREEGNLNLPDGSKWRQLRREGNEQLWQSLGHRPGVVLFECISLEELPVTADVSA